VEVARRYMEGFGRQTPQEVTDYVDAFWDPEGDYYPLRKFPGSRPRHGRAEISRHQAELRAVWDRFEVEVKELTPVGDDRVLAHGSWSIEGAESGLNLKGDAYHCFWLRDGRLFRLEDHLTLAGALHALGLSGDSLEAAGLRE
jgi:SnoaL-like domain